MHKVFSAVEDFPFPTVTAINGDCLGGGFELGGWQVESLARGDEASSALHRAVFDLVVLDWMLFGNPAVKYDPRELEWIGSMGKQQQICVTLEATASDSASASS